MNADEPSTLQQIQQELEREIPILSQQWESKAEEMLCLWDKAIPFGKRPEWIFFQNYENLPSTEIARRLYLVCEWYKEIVSKQNPLREKVLEQLLKEFSSSSDLIQ